MAATQYGTALNVGIAVTAFSGSYICESHEYGDYDTNKTEQKNEAGVLVTVVVKQRMAKETFSLVAKSGAAPQTDFPKDTAITAFTAYSGWWVDDCRITRTEDPMKVSLTLVNKALAVTT